MLGDVLPRDAHIIRAQEVEQANREREEAERAERKAQLALEGQTSQEFEDDSLICPPFCSVM